MLSCNNITCTLIRVAPIHRYIDYQPQNPPRVYKSPSSPLVSTVRKSCAWSVSDSSWTPVRRDSNKMMDDWCYRMPAPHLTAAVPPHCHGLDFGRTMPLRHPNINLSSPRQSFLPFSAPLGASSMPLASRELPISPSSPPFSSSQSQPRSNESVRVQNAEKKPWQTANYRWMFTKRKGSKLGYLKWNYLNIAVSYVSYNPVTQAINLVYNPENIFLYYYTIVCMFSSSVRFFLYL